MCSQGEWINLRSILQQLNSTFFRRILSSPYTIKTMIKTVVLGLLLVLSLAQTNNIEELVEVINESGAFAELGYIDIPADSEDQPYPFVKTILEYTYPTLQQWSLVDIKEKSEESNNQTIFIYTFFELYEDEDGNVTVVDLSISTVIQHEETLFTIFEEAKPIRTFDKADNSYWDHNEAGETAQAEENTAPAPEAEQTATQTGGENVAKEPAAAPATGNNDQAAN